jgi:CheY-like chemotaxis protein
MKILILDDDLTRHYYFKQNFSHHELTMVVTAYETILKLQEERFDALFLDHDLGGNAFVDSFGDEQTGYTVAKWLVSNPERKPERIYIHSLNSVGARNIKALLPESVLSPGLWAEKQGY